MTNQILSTASAYPCPKCGMWVSQHITHFCVSGYDVPQECGHSRHYIVSSDEDTHYCLMCNFQAAEFAAQEARRILQAEKEKAYTDGWSDAIGAAEDVIWPAEVWDAETFTVIEAIAAAKKSAMKAVRNLQPKGGNHASQQPHAVDLASASLRPNH